jgi:fumarylacetoacetase
VAIGDQVLDLRLAREQCPWGRRARHCWQPLAAGDLNAASWRWARGLAQAACRAVGGAGAGQRPGPFLEPAWCRRRRREMALPCRIGDYTDFYAGIHHARNIGKLFRPDNPLLPNYQWVPIGYHGRASSSAWAAASSGPAGSSRAPGEVPRCSAPASGWTTNWSGRLRRPPNALGEPVPMDKAEDALFGLVLLNDWSARDIQAWEYQPLGPFLARASPVRSRRGW